MSRIVSFRGLLADGGQDTISLQTNNGLTGYKIVKFQIISSAPGNDNEEAVIQLWKEKQTTAVATIDFSDNRLLGCGFSAASSNAYYAYGSPVIIFDNEIFNQDIYITYKAQLGSTAMNYYIELEQMDLALDEATVATLKDIRNTGTQ